MTTPDYYSCDPLPEEWIQMFEETQHNITQLINKSEMSISLIILCHIFNILIGSSRYSPGISRNGSARKLGGVKNNLKNITTGKLNASAKELRVKTDLPELAVSGLGSDARYSPTRSSLFGEDKSVSHVPVEV